VQTALRDRPGIEDGIWQGDAGSLAYSFPTYGTVRTFTLTPVGDIEGIILTDGTEVHVPPHLTAQVAAAVRPGESVAVRGWRGNVPNFVVAAALTGERGQSVIDQGPPPPGSMPPPPPPGQPAPGAQQATVQGRVQQLLHGPADDVNGARRWNDCQARPSGGLATGLATAAGASGHGTGLGALQQLWPRGRHAVSRAINRADDASPRCRSAASYAVVDSNLLRMKRPLFNGL
jgi:hypothetical protein